MYSNYDDDPYPIAHTCSEEVEIGNYTSLEMMKERFKTAMLTCGEIDDDGDYYGNENSDVFSDDHSVNLSIDDRKIEVESDSVSEPKWECLSSE